MPARKAPGFAPKPGDIAIFVITAGITVLCAASIYRTNQNALRLLVKSGKHRWVYPLDKDAQVDIPGPLGNTRLQLMEGSARVCASPCTNKTCIGSGAIRRQGQWIACLPNGVFVSVESAAAPAGPEKPARRNTGEPDAAAW